jgi:hypothetical protein
MAARTIPVRELEAQFPPGARVRFKLMPSPYEPPAEGVGTVAEVVEDASDTGTGESGPSVSIAVSLMVVPDGGGEALYVMPGDGGDFIVEFVDD